MPHSRVNRSAGSWVGISRLECMARDSGHRLRSLIVCWREHIDLIAHLIELENKMASLNEVRHMRFEDLEENKREGQCVITRQVFNNDTCISVLPCGHYFCKGACARWLANHNTCPVCRYEVYETRARASRGDLGNSRVRVSYGTWDGNDESTTGAENENEEQGDRERGDIEVAEAERTVSDDIVEENASVSNSGNS